MNGNEQVPVIAKPLFLYRKYSWLPIALLLPIFLLGAIDFGLGLLGTLYIWPIFSAVYTVAGIVLWTIYGLLKGGATAGTWRAILIAAVPAILTWLSIATGPAFHI